MTGIELLSAPTKGSMPPPVEVRTIEPDESPGVVGVVALTWTVWLWPGARNSELGETEPNGTNFCVDTCQGMAPFVPPAEATSPKMTPVQVPAARLADVHVAEVAHALRQGVRGEAALRVDEDEPHARVVAAPAGAG